MEDHNISPKPLRLFVKLLNGKTATLNFSTPSAYGHEIKNRIYETTKIPTHLQRLIYSGFQLKEGSVISDDNITFHLVLPLLGGKGGFGSLLRGAATKAGQKKTNNFDACRDMSGRRLRHVNAEKKLEEWKVGEEERRLEKIAEEFIKKTSKKGKKGVGDGEAEKYVSRYREESAKCVAKVEESVRQAFGNGKRKTVGTAAPEFKRLKIWMGKRKLGESEDEDSDDDDGEENEKSIVLNAGNQSDSNEETEGSTGSVTGGKPDGELSDEGSSESVSEEERGTLVQEKFESSGYSGEDVHPEENGVAEPKINEEKVQSTEASSVELKLVSATEADHKVSDGPASGDVEEIATQSPNILSSRNEEVNENKPMDAEAVVACTTVGESERPLDFNEFNSAVEMEALGMERLKSELQARGLKCGGTLQERAARLFLLKSTPVEKLSKKLLAKK